MKRHRARFARRIAAVNPAAPAPRNAALAATHAALAIAFAAGLAGCSAPTPPPPGAPLTTRDLPSPFAARAARVPLADAPGYVDPRVAGRLRDLRGDAVPAPAPPDVYVLDALASPLTGARLDDTLGDRLDDALDAAADDGRPVETWGPAALTLDELFGDDLHAGVCELPRFVTTVAHEGEDWEIAVGVSTFEQLVGDLALAYGTLPEACVADLAEAAGDVDAAGACDAVDEAMFFPEGSDCRACLGEAAGDFAACVEAEACAAEAPLLESQGGRLWNRFEATLLACAPDWTVPAYVLAAADATGAPPAPFDYGAWRAICAPFWDEYLGEVDYTCIPGDDTMRVGVSGVVDAMRRPGDDTPWYRTRTYYTPRITLADGTDIRWGWEAYGSAGVVSYPVEPDDTNGDGVVDAGDDYYGYQFGSWGLNPMQLRPDGTDPDALDDTFARDWFGAVALKRSTTRDGIGVLMANHSRCAEWDDLDGDGVFRCTRTEDPVAGWLADLAHFNWDPDAGYSYPMPVLTMGSTGLPDPTIPGGIVPRVLGTPTLADPEWDGCAWPETFTPDRATLPDTPLAYTAPGVVTADTWRFGGHDLDLRVVLYTNSTRDFCPDAGIP